MDLITVSIGAVVIGFGFYTLYARIKTPEKLGKLQAMREKFGKGIGTTIHTTAYSVIPLVFGSFIVNAGLNGVSIMQFIAV